MATQKKGHLDNAESLTMKALRGAHRRLRRAKAVRISFRRWLRREGTGLSFDSIAPKARKILEAA